MHCLQKIFSSGLLICLVTTTVGMAEPFGSERRLSGPADPIELDHRSIGPAEPFESERSSAGALSRAERSTTVVIELTAVRPDSSRTRVFRWLYRDLGALAKNVATPKFALYSAGTMAGTFGLAWLDDDAGEAVKSVYNGTFKDVLDVTETLGGPNINLPVVVLAGGSLLTNSVKFQDAAFTSLQTLIYAGLIGYGLKGLFGRERPEWSDNTYAFFSRTGKNPFSHEGNSSYPGGHAIAAFGIVTPWVMYYPSPITYALYALPLGTGVSRIAEDKHWATDIAVGALIGVSMGRWLSRRHQEMQRANDKLELSVLEGGKLFRITLHIE